MEKEELLELGIIAYREGQYDKALSYLSEAIEKYSPSPDVLFQLGNVLSQLGRHKQAIETFRICCAMDTKSSEPHTNMGNSFRYIGDYASAIEEFQTALKLNPKDRVAINNLSICKKILKDIDKYSNREYFSHVMQTTLSMIDDSVIFIMFPEAKRGWTKEIIKFEIKGYKN
jgi:tetratricopeptide (TPR) repeat protein